MHWFRTLTHPATVAALLAAAAISASATAAPDRYLATARLFGPTTLKGKARYEERPKNGSLMRRFTVELEHGLPGQTRSILVNGIDVGSVTINPLGRASFELRTEQHIDSPEDGDPMPLDFPQLGIGDNVSVGPIAGTFFLVSTPPGDPSPPAIQNFRLRGDLDGAGAESGKVEYRERFKNGGGLERRFKVEVEDAAPNSNLEVRVNGKLVTIIATDGSGFVEFEYRTAAFIDSPDDGIPMPSTFPSLVDGDEVAVGSLSTTLQASGGGGG